MSILVLVGSLILPLMPAVVYAETSVDLSPVGIGSFNNWSQEGGSGGNGDEKKVDAVLAHNGDTSFIKEDDNNKAQTFTVADANIPEGSEIDSVTLYAYARRVSQGSAKIKLRVENGTLQQNISDGDEISLDNSYTLYSRAMATNPLTGSVWTYSEVNDWQVNFGAVKTNNNKARITQLYVVVDYTAPEEEIEENPGSLQVYKYDYDSGELIPGWEICLYEAAYVGDVGFEAGDLIRCEDTSSNEESEFYGAAVFSGEDLAPGLYVVDEEERNGWRLQDWEADNYEDVNEDLGQLLISIEDGDFSDGSNYNIYFYNQGLAVITGHKFNDLNGDGSWEFGEEVIAGWPIALGRVNENNNEINELDEGENQIPIEIVALSLTGADGSYSLEAPEPGHYAVFEARRAGWSPITPTEKPEWAIFIF